MSFWDDVTDRLGDLFDDMAIDSAARGYDPKSGDSGFSYVMGRKGKEAAKRLAQVASIYPVGITLDMARIVTPKNRWLDEGAASHLGTKKSLSALSDLLLGEETITGAALGGVSRTSFSLWSLVSDLGVETPLYALDMAAAGDDASFGAAFDVAREGGGPAEAILSSIGQGYSALGIQPSEGIMGGSELDPNAPLMKAYDLNSRDRQNPGFRAFSDVSNIVAQWYTDPLAIAGKGAGARAAAHRLAPIADNLRDWAGDLLGAAVPRYQKVGDDFVRVESPIDETLDAGAQARHRARFEVLFGKIDDAGEYTAGAVHGRSTSEIRALLDLERHEKGGDIAALLHAADNLDNPELRVAATRDIIATIYGDSAALGRLNDAAPHLGHRFANIVKSKATGEEDAFLADEANALAILKGETLPTYMQPQAVASKAEEVEAQPGFYNWLHNAVTDRTFNLTPKGERAVARLNSEGVFRDFTFHSGHTRIDSGMNALLGYIKDKSMKGDGLVEDAAGLAGGAKNKPAQRWFLNHGTVPARFHTFGVERITWEKMNGLGKAGAASAYISGVTPMGKALTKISNDLRSQMVYGRVNVEDGALAAAVLRGIAVKLNLPPEMTRHYADMIDRAENAPARARALDEFQTNVVSFLSNKYGVNADLIGQIGMRRTPGKMAQTADDPMVFGPYTGREGAIDPATGNPRRVDQVPTKGKVADLIGPDGRPIPMEKLADEDGFQTVPVWNTQTVNDVTIMDFHRIDKWLKRDHAIYAISKWIDDRKVLPKHLSWAKKQGLYSNHGTLQKLADSELAYYASYGAEHFNSALKTNLLVTRPFSFMVRNTAEEMLRIMGKGMTAVWVDEVRAHRQFLTTSGKVRKQGEVDDTTRAIMDKNLEDIDDLQAQLDDPEFAEVMKQLRAERRAALAKVKDALAEGNSRKAAYWQKRADSFKAGPHWQHYDEMRAQQKAILEHNTLLEQEALSRRVLPRSGTQTIEGVEVPEAYAGPEGTLAWDTTAGGIVDRAALAYGAHLDTRLRRSGQQDILFGGQALLRAKKDVVDQHLDQWTYILNYHLLNDEVARLLLKAKGEGADAEEMAAVAHHFYQSPEGAAYIRKNPQRSRDVDTWVGDQVDYINTIVPSQNLAAHLGEKQPVTREMLDEAFPRTSRPDVSLTEADTLYGVHGKLIERTVSKMFNWMERASLGQLTRHPMYAAFYNAAMKDRITTFKAKVIRERGEDAKLTADEINDLVKSAHGEASRRMKQTFYDNTVRSNAAHQTRFLFPFFAAHQNSMTFWANTIAENPGVIRRFQMAFEAPVKLGIVTDREGNVIEPGTPISAEHTVWMQVPPNWGGPQIGGEDRESAQQGSGVVLSLQSLNLLTPNGSVLNPGAGQLAAVPAGWLQAGLFFTPKALRGSRSEEMGKILKVFNEFGAPAGDVTGRTVTGFMSTPERRFVDLLNATLQTDSYAYTTMLSTRIMDKNVKFELENGRPARKGEFLAMKDEATAEVRWTTVLRLLSSLTLPSQARPTSKFQGFMDEYYRLRDEGIRNGEGPLWAQDQFLEKYGTPFMWLVQGATENLAHLTPSTATWRSLDRHKDFIEKNKISFNSWAILVGPEGTSGEGGGIFNTDAYRAMQDYALGPGIHLIQKEDLLDWRKGVQIAQGWREYNKVVDGLAVEAAARGLDSADQDPELVEYARWAKAKIAEDFPVWAQHRALKRANFEDELWPDIQKIVSNKKLLKRRSDLQALKAYADYRKEVLAELAYREGTDKFNMQTVMTKKSNADLAEDFAGYVNWLADQNTYFADYGFNYAVESDPLYRPDVLQGLDDQ